MTSPLFDIPNIPVSTNNATTYTHATTFLELVDMLRVQISSVNNSMESYSDSLNGIIDNVNQACEAALAACQKLSVDAATMNVDTTANLDVAAGNLAAAKHDLDLALAASNAALASAQQVLDSYQDDVARQDSDISAQFDTINQVVSRAVTKNSLTVNVMDYGATGDGSTDDTQAIINAVAAAGSNGTVFFQKGSYRFTSPIHIPNDQLWHGTGISDTGNVSYSQALIADFDPTQFQGYAIECPYNSGISNIKIVGTNKGQGIYAHGAVNLYRVSISNFSTGIFASSLWYGYFDNIRTVNTDISIAADYVYNLTINAPRIAAMTYEGNPSRGIVMTRQCSITIHGGAIESFDYAISASSGNQQHISLFGTYFESTPTNKTYTEADGAEIVDIRHCSQIEVMAVGCLVYLNSVKYFIDAYGTDTASSITSMGNTFKGGKNTNETYSAGAYRWSNNSPVQMFIAGDMWATNHNTNYYEPTLNPGVNSIILPPRNCFVGTNAHGIGVGFNGSNLVSTGDFITVPNGTSLPDMSSSNGGRNRYIGAMFFLKGKNKLAVWNGAGWTAADGSAL